MRISARFQVIYFLYGCNYLRSNTSFSSSTRRGGAPTHQRIPADSLNSAPGSACSYNPRAAVTEWKGNLLLDSPLSPLHNNQKLQEYPLLRETIHQTAVYTQRHRRISRMESDSNKTTQTEDAAAAFVASWRNTQQGVAWWRKIIAKKEKKKNRRKL